MTDLVLAERRGAVLLLTLNRPGAYNALSVALMGSLHSEVVGAGNDPGVHVVVIRGAGRGFCAGHDLKEMRANPGRAFMETTIQRCTELMLSIVRSPKPIIAAVHGVATAAGCQLVASADLALAASDARFATPGVNIGLFCSTPMVALSRSVGRKHALEMLLTGDFLSAARAESIGLINRVVPGDELLSETLALAGRIATKSPLTIKTGKSAFQTQVDLDLEAAYTHCAGVMVENMMARDAREGIDALLEKREPRWTGT